MIESCALLRIRITGPMTKSLLWDPGTKICFFVMGSANPSNFGCSMVAGLRGEQMERLCP
jgi:hypothetical protein